MNLGAAIDDLCRLLQGGDNVDPTVDAARLVDLVGSLEMLKAVASGAQARWTAQLVRMRGAELMSVRGDRDAVVRRDVGAQIGLARRVGPRVGARLVGLARVLTTEMPETMAALSAGRIDEYQALMVVGETATLSRDHRAVVDAELADRFGTMSATRVRAEAARIGYRLDPGQAVRRFRKAVGDRCVTLRPAPDTMTWLTALLPVAEGVAAYAALDRAAATATALGDPRGRGALMADTLSARLVVGGAPAGAVDPAPRPAACGIETSPALQEDPTEGLPGLPPGVNLEIQLLMTDRTLFTDDPEPALLAGYGPIPAPIARHLARSAGRDTAVWVRRLYTDSHGRISDADRRRRSFSHAARQLLVARDQVCRTPWCDAPIRHADHTTSHARGGHTAPDNGAGRCVTCNQVKEHPGWTTSATADGGIVTTTPTGHRHRSDPPPAPGVTRGSIPSVRSA